MGRLFHEAMIQVEHLRPHHWVWVVLLAILVGVALLRGFGSRSQY